MKINPRASSRKPSFKLWQRHPTISRIVLAGAIGCFYLTFTGNNNGIHLMEEQQATTTNLQHLINIPLGDTSHHDDEQQSALSTTTTTTSSLPEFPGYPLTRQAMLDVGAKMAAATTKVQRHHYPPKTWCHPRPLATTNFLVPNINTTSRGLFFVKTPKTASQTINRILRRAVTKVGYRHLRKNPQACFLRAHHIQGDPGLWYGRRQIQHSVLLTSLRDPAPRALSRIYWTLSTRKFKGKVGLDMIQKALETWVDVETGCISKGQGGFQLSYTSFTNVEPNSAWTLGEPSKVQNPDAIHTLVQQILEDYNFILVQERLEESLVAMQLLLGLETTDILSMPLHVGGSYLYDRHAGCLELFSPPTLPHLATNQELHDPTTFSSITTNQVLEYLDHYLQSPTWYAQNYGDYVLLGAAQARLDATIADLGLDKFQLALKQFRQMQQHVLNTCSQKVVFPCSVNGTIQRDDFQIGHPKASGDRYPQRDIEACIDEVVLQVQQQQQQQSTTATTTKK